MKFAERTITLKDGRTCILKPNSPEYAAEMIEYLKKTCAETDFLLRNPDEVNFTLEREAEILGNLLEDPYHAMMIALVDGRPAGNGSVSGIGEKRKIRHRCSLAIALYKEFWGLGIGTAMIDYLSELARGIGWEQMDLEVVAENERAQALYKKCGFIESGRRHNGVRFDDGTYHDEILMYKDLTK
ncbi:MAG: GNAT family N-acetyltransferase [Lachnospiraceae bacterium]|nr:GNAT family N-acetyltransferase [Lachnospiraceae bacterium]